MSALVIVLLVLAGLVIAAAAVCCPRLWRRHKLRVARELAVGHVQTRERLRIGLGRQYKNVEHVVKADTMRGWVWIAMTRNPPEKSFEETGWKPTKRAAWRALDHRRRMLDKARRRS